MIKLKAKDIFIYLIKILSLFVIILIICSQLISCSYLQPITWPVEYCPVEIKTQPNNAIINQLLSNKIACAKMSNSKYQLIIKHATNIDQQILSAQNPVKINPYQITIKATLINKITKKQITTQSLVRNLKFTSLPRPIEKTINQEEKINILSNLIDNIILLTTLKQRI